MSAGELADRLAALIDETPGRDADPETRAAWYDRQAQVFERIVSERDRLVEEALQAARRARAEARRLRAGGGS